jgi:hypothetical protein
MVPDFQPTPPHFLARVKPAQLVMQRVRHHSHHEHRATDPFKPSPMRATDETSSTSASAFLCVHWLMLCGYDPFCFLFSWTPSVCHIRRRLAFQKYEQQWKSVFDCRHKYGTDDMVWAS